MIGIDISDGSIKLVQRSKTEGDMLQSFCWRVIEEGVIERGVIVEPKKLRQAIVQTFEQCHL